MRTALENQSLGCSSTVPCTLEVIPIDGINCDNPDPDAACNQVGDLPPGKVNNGQAPQDAVAPGFWSSASNWDRRVPVPLDFSPPPSVCTVAKAGKPVPFYGSELLDQTALQWVPAYCLNKKRFNWQDNVMPDDAAFALMQSGEAAAAEVSARGANDSARRLRADGGDRLGDRVQHRQAEQRRAAEVDQAQRPPARQAADRVLPGLDVGRRRVTRASPTTRSRSTSTPTSIKLNPGLDLGHWSESAATLLANSTSSQVMYQLSSYLAADPKAMAFINGKPEHDGPYTMRVNPAYQHMKLPVDSWPQLDTWQFKAAPNSCLKAQGDAMPPYMPLIANPVTSLQLVAQAMLFNWPNVETGCTGTGTQDDPYQLGRVAPQGLGNRFMLGLVTLGDAQRYGLTTAKLQAAPGHYVASDSAGIKAALALAGKTSKLRPFDLTQAEIRRSADGIPGLDARVHRGEDATASPAATAQDVAQFIRVSSTEGQQPGRGNGQLAAGYVPITSSGVTRGLYLQAQEVADAVAAQKAPPTPPASHSPTPPASPPAGPAAGWTAGRPPRCCAAGLDTRDRARRSTRRRHDDRRGRRARQDRGGLSAAAPGC